METQLNLLLARLILVKEDMEIILHSDFDYDFVTDKDNVNATLNNVNRALEIVKELQIKNTNL